ncbi:hypothetical protein SLEP1_g34437 [Rubroshorea leprosula]|uniref:Uncharacterized protein n=1 Tax=Rubroshorea leprosula TaxID=152421 RepID=A0AAV5KJW2_9ROSI|nr:hypothetical protein SLEP1_g34437 [Rubroshorea leprosula]
MYERKRGKFLDLLIFLSKLVLPFPVHEFGKIVLDLPVTLALG